MASKKNKYSIESKETKIKEGDSYINYKDILIKVLSRVPDEGLNTSEMNDRIIVLKAINSNKKNIEFSNESEVKFILTLLSSFKFPFINIEVINLQNELSSLL